jgi:MIP family channel proteins
MAEQENVSSRQQWVSSKLLRVFAVEMVGTYILVLFGTASVASAVLTGALSGLGQVAAVWAVGVALGIYVSANVSGAHLNPAVTLSFTIFRPGAFPPKLLPGYWIAQLLGGVLAGLSVLAIFRTLIKRFEDAHGLVRGEAGSEHSAMVFGQYFPNPDVFRADEAASSLVGVGGALFVEAFGAAVLVLVIFALTEKRNGGLSRANLTPILIGSTVAALLALFAPLTQAGWNPARDFGPRLVSLLAGWDSIAIPGPSNGFWIYIAGPLIGGPIGAAIHEYLVRPGLPKDDE